MNKHTTAGMKKSLSDYAKEQGMTFKKDGEGYAFFKRGYSERVSMVYPLIQWSCYLASGKIGSLAL